MSSGVWMSDLRSNHALGDKVGVRTKYFGHDWQPAEFRIPRVPDEVFASIQRASRGGALLREELPEAAAVWNEKRFKLFGDIFYASGFLVVRGRLAEAFARSNIGEGGLVPFPIFCDDLQTPYPGEFFLLNFGCTKDYLLVDQSRNLEKFVVEKTTGIQIWEVNGQCGDGDVALTDAALSGPDLWIERRIYNKIFVSDSLGQNLIDLGLAEVFDLTRCEVTGVES